MVRKSKSLSETMIRLFVLIMSVGIVSLFVPIKAVQCMGMTLLLLTVYCGLPCAFLFFALPKVFRYLGARDSSYKQQYEDDG